MDDILKRLPPEMASLTRAVLTRLRKLLPGAVEMVYDKSNALVIGFCPTEKPSSAINSIAVYRKWINLYFFEGDTLPDPERLLQGTGAMVRHIRITDARDLDRPAVKALVAEARKRSDPALNPNARRKVVLRQTRRAV